ncbi:polymorphic toxin-type HINT domain-containing protein [Microbispora amethystogenes]|uniref:polymorphic toxin-type HINT domain-containing protein n=1 Tax=Microbispora amethystogenes TaxID=1427754 RepID=UPI0033C326EA
MYGNKTIRSLTEHRPGDRPDPRLRRQTPRAHRHRRRHETRHGHGHRRPPLLGSRRHTWVDAKNLKPGMWLRTSAGTLVQITAIKKWTAHHQHAHNLTIADLHTYYVQAGVPVLVHNCGIGPDGLINLEKASQSRAAADRGGLSFAGRALQKHADRPGTGVNWPRPSGDNATQPKLIIV